MFAFSFDVMLVEVDFIRVERDFQEEGLRVTAGTFRTFSNEADVLRRRFRLDGRLVRLDF